MSEFKDKVKTWVVAHPWKTATAVLALLLLITWANVL